MDTCELRTHINVPKGRLREMKLDGDGGFGPLMKKATVEEIVRLRDEAIIRYGNAHAALDVALNSTAAAHKILSALSGKESRFNHHQRAEKGHFMHVEEPQDRDAYMKVARRLVDTEVWSHIVEITNLERLMDKQAKDELHAQLTTEPPEVTVENIRATLERFAGDAGMIFRRGVANCFTKLDRRFRSHDGWKIGSRLILARMFDENGWWNYHRDMESTLLDIDRAFRVLDGKPVGASYGGIVGALRNARNGRYGAHQTEVEDEYFTVRVFKNGNCHAWFKRDDLVDKVNQLLGEYYGAPIPEERDAEEDPLATPKTSLAKNYGFFPTPDKAADFATDGLPLYREKDAPPLKILEPNAGEGALASRCLKHGALVDCVEVQPKLADALRGTKRYRSVTCADFLALRPPTNPDDLYDLVVMNPPFDRERDIDHVVHAMKFLKPRGHLMAIMSAGTEFRETKKSQAFRALMEGKKARWRDLPAGSFSSVGTNCNTVRVRFYNDGSHFYDN